MNPYKIVSDFEELIADYSGSRYAVAVDSCSAAIFLSLQYCQVKGSRIFIPKFTYPSVPCSIIHSGGKVKFTNTYWDGVYKLEPFPIIDGALRFSKGMYHGGFHCLSFHLKKRLPIGRGGMILTDNPIAYNWFKKARFDGRNPVPLKEDTFTMLGWNCYMEPANAARGIQLFEMIKNKNLPDLDREEQGYADLSKFKIYTQ